MERKKESHIGENLRHLQILVPSRQAFGLISGRGRTYLGKGMPHKTSFRTTQLQISNDCGVKTAINKSNFPILERLALNPGCFREPHWRANSLELRHCLKGKTLVTLFASGNQHSHFTIPEGEMFFAPQQIVPCDRKSRRRALRNSPSSPTRRCSQHLSVRLSWHDRIPGPR